MLKMCSVGSIVSNDHHVSMLSVATSDLPPLTDRFLIVRLSVLTPVTVTDMCGSASKFMFLSGFLRKCRAESSLDCSNRGFVFCD